MTSLGMQGKKSWMTKGLNLGFSFVHHNCVATCD